MEGGIKTQILKMLIPLVGTWWLIDRILPNLKVITWWDYHPKSIPITFAIVAYQAIWWGLLKWATEILSKNPIVL